MGMRLEQFLMKHYKENDKMEQIGIVLSIRGFGQQEPTLRPWSGYETDTPGLCRMQKAKVSRR